MAPIARTGYCVVQHESLRGWAGVEIACAVVAMLEKVVEQNPQITKICLCADSCAL